ncbi:uncharacterized protein LOC141527007 [Cotesia typhae]|uniref:uncharacterized protein LOC141527007 n=1 Tax=Cotesia typhae TaxID=2053667 RepID=UPI003D69195F
MKTLSLIPFVIGLIGFETCREESPELWKFGPEYLFKFGVNLAIVKELPDMKLCVNATMAVKCRPFSTKAEEFTDALQCYVQDADKINYNVDEEGTKILNSDEDSQKLVAKLVGQKFEIIYEKRGIKELRVLTSIQGAQLNIFRMIATHLDFGFDKFDKGGERFAFVEAVAPEKSLIGKCETTFEVSKQIKFKSMRWDSKCGDKLHIETFAYGDKSPMIAMDKIRDVRKCTKISPTIFGEVHNRLIPAILNITMQSSVTTFVVAPHGFQSHSQNIGTMKYNSNMVKNNDGKLGDTHEHINLYLESIEPATDELKRIPSSHSATIFANDPPIVN